MNKNSLICLIMCSYMFFMFEIQKKNFFNFYRPTNNNFFENPKKKTKKT